MQPTLLLTGAAAAVAAAAAAEEQALLPYVAPWGAVGEPPPPNRTLTRDARRLQRMYASAAESPKQCRFACDDAKPHWWESPRAATEVGRQLYENGFVFADGFQAEEAAAEVFNYISGLKADGLLVGGRIQGDNGSSNNSVGQTPAGASTDAGMRSSLFRGDDVAWLRLPAMDAVDFTPTANATQNFPAGTPAAAAPLCRYVRTLDRLIRKLQEQNRTAGNIDGGLGGIRSRSNAMATYYPVGARYVRHTDNSCHAGVGYRCNGRRLTAIGYFRDPAAPSRASDDGAVRLFGDEELGHLASLQPRVDIESQHNRVLLFWSDHRTPHEVLPARTVGRFAVTLWFHDAQEEENLIATAAAVERNPMPS